MLATVFIDCVFSQSFEVELVVRRIDTPTHTHVHMSTCLHTCLHTLPNTAKSIVGPLAGILFTCCPDEHHIPDAIVPAFAELRSASNVLLLRARVCRARDLFYEDGMYRRVAEISLYVVRRLQSRESGTRLN